MEIGIDMDKIELLTPIAGIIAVIIGVCLNIIAIHLPELEMIIAFVSASVLILAGISAILNSL